VSRRGRRWQQRRGRPGRGGGKDLLDACYRYWRGRKYAARGRNKARAIDFD
jgi:hypothetical protein